MRSFKLAPGADKKILIGLLVIGGLVGGSYFFNQQQLRAATVIEGVYCGTLNQAKAQVSAGDREMQDCLYDHFRQRQPATLIVEIVIPPQNERLSSTYVTLTKRENKFVIKRTEIHQQFWGKYFFTYVECGDMKKDEQKLSITSCHNVDSPALNYGDMELWRNLE